MISGEDHYVKHYVNFKCGKLMSCCYLEAAPFFFPWKVPFSMKINGMTKCSSILFILIQVGFGGK